MANDPNYHELHANDKYSVGHVFENIYITNKIENKTINIGSMYGEPSCALISEENSWCIVGGSELLLWKENTVIEIKDDNLYWACRLRQSDHEKVQILVDPWSEGSSIWELNIHTLESEKIRDFDSYKGKTYTENIDW